jgi:hypothetical protein
VDFKEFSKIVLRYRYLQVFDSFCKYLEEKCVQIIMRNFDPLQYLIGQTINFTSEALSIKRKILGDTLHVNKYRTPLTFRGHVISISHNGTYLSVENVRV